MEIQDLKRNVDLEKFLTEQGYTINKGKSTRSTPVYEKGGERLIIRQGNDCKTYYVGEGNERGTIIDFLKNRPELLSGFPARNVFESIKKCLSEFLCERPSCLTVPQQENAPLPFSSSSFFIPQNKDIESRCFSYLKHRGISQETLSSPVFENTGLIKIENSKEYKFYNLAFPLFNKEGVVNGIDYRFFDQSGKGYKMLLSGTDKKNSVGISSNKQIGINELILTESPIDAMSHYQLFRCGRTDVKYLYFEGTVTKGQTDLFLECQKQIPQITLGFDNDPDGKLTGQAYTTAILCSLIVGKPVTCSYEGKSKFAFVTEDLKEMESEMKEILKETGVSFHENEKSFSFTFPKEKSIINSVNAALLQKLPNVKIETSLTNDWNDDLKIKLRAEEKQKTPQAKTLKR